MRVKSISSLLRHFKGRERLPHNWDLNPSLLQRAMEDVRPLCFFWQWAQAGNKNEGQHHGPEASLGRQVLPVLLHSGARTQSHRHRGGWWGDHTFGDFTNHQFQGRCRLHQLSSWLSPASNEIYKSPAVFSEVQLYILHNILWIQQNQFSNNERNHWELSQVYNHLKKTVTAIFHGL